MEEMNNGINEDNINEDEIDLIDLVCKLWARRKLLLKSIIIFMIIGFFIAISMPNEYEASSIMIPQTSEKRAGGSLSGLAAIAGISLGSITSGEALPPSIYPQILGNVNFQRELIYSKFSIQGTKIPITYFDYKTDKKYSSFNLIGFVKKYTLGLPGIIIGGLKGSIRKEISNEEEFGEIEKLTFDESKIIESLFTDLSLSINDKEGYITLSFKSGEPNLTAEMVLTAQKLLQKYITKFKVQKVQSNLDFVESSYYEAQRNFEVKQAELATFRDRNISLSSAIAKTQEEKLISEYNLVLSIYTELAKQREQAKIAVTETTPILTVIKPPIIPNTKSGPNRLMIMLGFTFLGFIISSGLVLGSSFFKELIFKIK